MKEQSNWFLFAEEDHRMAKKAIEEKIYNQTCFHAQQAVEKMLKGFLKSKKISVPKTHFLVELLKLCIGIDKDFAELKDKSSILDDYYIPTRYPDAIPGSLPENLPQEKDAKEALSILEHISKFIADKI